MSDIYEVYNGNDLGNVYTPEQTSFRLWAPTAEAVQLALYQAGDGDCLIERIPMQKGESGTWLHIQSGDCQGMYYTYEVSVDGKVNESQDPYGKTCGVNGLRSMVLDLASTNPEGFEQDKPIVLKQPTDAVIYELSVRDTTADESSGAKNKGLFLGLAEAGTINKNGVSTGFDHIKALGVTHIQLMPMYDFGSIDEADRETPQYNWGYDPINYNVPEGSYSTDPFHGEVRVRELKQMIQAYHKAGLGVVMDVVYNHTYDIENNCFQKTVPDYYYRKDGDKYSDASACGNEVATDLPMVRKYIVDSVCYWAKEYHLDGFRFDLMGVIDIETMQIIADRLKEINPSILVYGEGWTGGPSTLPDDQRALKINVGMLKNVGMFSDDIRDTVRGHVFYNDEAGFIDGAPEKSEDLRFSIVGAVRHPQVDYEKYSYTKTGPWAKNPVDVINYVSCHDNLTLWDKLLEACPDASVEERMSMNRLATAIVMTSQGIPFMLSGEEFARTKPMPDGTVCENSFNVPVEVNSMKYDLLEENCALVEYYKGMIAFRKAHELFRMTTAEEVCEKLSFTDTDEGIVQFTLKGDTETICVMYNARKEKATLTLPESGEWQVFVEDVTAGTQPLRTVSEQIEVAACSCSIVIK